jgi:hypothetical protein
MTSNLGPPEVERAGPQSTDRLAPTGTSTLTAESLGVPRVEEAGDSERARRVFEPAPSPPGRLPAVSPRLPSGIPRGTGLPGRLRDRGRRRVRRFGDLGARWRQRPVDRPLRGCAVVAVTRQPWLIVWVDRPSGLAEVRGIELVVSSPTGCAEAGGDPDGLSPLNAPPISLLSGSATAILWFSSTGRRRGHDLVEAIRRLLR